jgi:hypothetical protein
MRRHRGPLPRLAPRVPRQHPLPRPRDGASPAATWSTPTSRSTTRRTPRSAATASATSRAASLSTGVPHDITGLGSTGGSFAEGPWPRVRVALRLSPDAALRATLAVRDNTATGTLIRGTERLDVINGTATIADPEDPFTRTELRLELANGEQLTVVARALHRLPVVRIQPSGSLRLDFAACHLEGETTPAGWCEAAGL